MRSAGEAVRPSASASNLSRWHSLARPLVLDMEVIVRRQDRGHCASITCMIRHYGARRGEGDRRSCWTFRQFVLDRDVPGRALSQVGCHTDRAGVSPADSRNWIGNPVQCSVILSLRRDSRSRGDLWRWGWSGTCGRRGRWAPRTAHLRGPVTKLTPHVLRHACASRLYAEGIGLAAIQQLLGHRWLSTTVRYVHVADDAIENAYQRSAERAAARFKE
jgi:Phage integrase family